MRNKIESSVHRSSGKLTLRRDRLKGFCLIGDEIVGRGQREEEVCLKTRELKLVEEEEDINCHGPIKCPFCSIYLLKMPL